MVQSTAREARFWSKVNRDGPVPEYRPSLGPCWLWTAGCMRGGYGHFWTGATHHGAHRFAYELLVGSIPDRLTLDHLCRNRACVNPHHLEAVSDRTNILRGQGQSARNALKTHCPQGHPYDLFNTGRGPDNRRICSICHEKHNRARVRNYQATTKK